MAELLTAAGLAQLHKVAAGHVGDDQIPGLVALIARGDQAHAEVLGSLAIGGPAMRRDSLFRIASLTKPVTGVATLALAAEGLLRLDDRCTDCCPNWPTAGCCAGWTAHWTTPSQPGARSPSATC